MDSSKNARGRGSHRLGGGCDHLLNDQKTVPDIVRELDALRVELVGGAVQLQEGISEGIPERRRKDAQHGVNGRREVLPLEGDDGEDGPDEHADNGDENDTHELRIRKGNETDHGRNSLLKDLHEDASTGKRRIHGNRQCTANQRSGLEEAEEEHEKEGQLHKGPEIGRRSNLDPPACSIAKEVPRNLLRRHRNPRDALRLQETLQRWTFGLGQGTQVSRGKRLRLSEHIDGARGDQSRKRVGGLGLPQESFGLPEESLSLVTLGEPLGLFGHPVEEASPSRLRKEGRHVLRRLLRHVAGKPSSPGLVDRRRDASLETVIHILNALCDFLRRHGCTRNALKPLGKSSQPWVHYPFLTL